MDIDHLSRDTVSLKKLSSLKAFIYLKSGSDDGYIFTFFQGDSFTNFKFIISFIIDYRNCQTAKSHINRSNILSSSFYSSSCFYVICRADNGHSRNCTHNSDILVTLMSSSILTYRDTGMSSTDLNVQVRISDRVTNLLKCSSCCEHSKRRSERDLSAGSKSCCYSHHISFSDTTVNVTLRECFFENTSLSSSCKVCIKYDNIRILCAKLCQSVTVAFSRCDLLYF